MKGDGERLLCRMAWDSLNEIPASGRMGCGKSELRSCQDWIGPLPWLWDCLDWCGKTQPTLGNTIPQEGDPKLYEESRDPTEQNQGSKGACVHSFLTARDYSCDVSSCLKFLYWLLQIDGL